MRASARAILSAALLLGTVIWWSQASAATTVQIIPSNPRYLEPVYARVNAGPFVPALIYGAQATMSGNSITVMYQANPDIGVYDYDVELGRFPAGTYTVQVQGTGGLAMTQFTVGPASKSAAFPGTVPAVNFSDLWWNPSESGWGISITQGATNVLFAEWFVYDATGKPVWYTLQRGQWTRTDFMSAYSGPIYKTTGPYFGGPFNAAAVGISLVGTGTLSFRDSSNGTFAYTVEGVTGMKAITRMLIE
jgi:hypothetical protein